jgi:GNAT superfamily N-acetyltransferase
MTAPAAASARIAIRALDAAEAKARLGELADILVDAVTHGASVNFMAGFSSTEAQTFWRNQLAGIADGEKHLFVGDDGERLVATVLMTLAQQPNQPHRADVGKMLVLSSLRRQGLGRRLLATVEQTARDARRTLLMLDTESGSAGDLLYRSCGWTAFGTVPGHAFRPDGRIADTTFFYKTLAPHDG